METLNFIGNTLNSIQVVGFLLKAFLCIQPPADYRAVGFVPRGEELLPALATVHHDVFLPDAVRVSTAAATPPHGIFLGRKRQAPQTGNPAAMETTTGTGSSADGGLTRQPRKEVITDANSDYTDSTSPKRQRNDDDGLQAPWSSREDTLEAVSGVWEKPRSRRQRQTDKTVLRAPSPKRVSDERRELGIHVLKIQLMEHTDVTTLPVHLLQQAIYRLAGDPQLTKYVILKTNKNSNSITVTTCDTVHAERLLRLRVIPISSDMRLRVHVYQLPTRGITRGVIYKCDPGADNNTLMSALKADGVAILAARPMGRNGTVLIHFASDIVPRFVTYHGFLRRVQIYQAKSLICTRCHKPGHKACSCPSPTIICKECGRYHDLKDSPGLCPYKEQAQHCVHCKKDGHLATSPDCPARTHFVEMLKIRQQKTRFHNCYQNANRQRRLTDPYDSPLPVPSKASEIHGLSQDSPPLDPTVSYKDDLIIAELQQERQKAEVHFAEEVAAIQKQLLMLKRNHEQRMNDITKRIIAHRQNLSIKQASSKSKANNTLKKQRTTSPAGSSPQAETSPDEPQFRVNLQATSHHKILPGLEEHTTETATLRVEHQQDMQSFQQCLQQIAQQLTDTQKTLQRIAMQLDGTTGHNHAATAHDFD